MDLRSIIAQLGQLEENRKVAGKAYGGSAQKDDDKKDDDKSSKELDTSGGSDIQDMIGKKPSKEVGTKRVSHKLKEYIEQVEATKKQLDEADITITPGTTQHLKGPKGDVIASVSDPTKAKQLAADLETGKVKIGQPQGMADRSLNEFAPSGGDNGDDGFSEETLKLLAAQWYNGDEDPRVEKTLMAAGWEIGQDENYDDEPGVFVVQSGDVDGDSFISWPANELRQGVAEEQVTEVAPPGMEDVVLSLKKKYPNQEGRAYAIAWDMYNKKKHKKDESMYESADADKQPIMEGKLQEILEAYPHEHKMCQEGWAMDEGFYEALCDHYYKEGRIPRKIWHGPLEELRKCVEGCYMEDMGMVSEERKEYDLPPSMRPPATLDTVNVSRTVDLVPQQRANRELNLKLYTEPSMKKLAFKTSEQGVAEGTGITDYNPKSHGGTRKELIARYHKTKDPKDAEAARRAGATQKELQGVAEGQAPTYNVINVQSGKSVGTFRDGVGFMPGSNAKAAGMKPSPTVPNGHKIDYKSIVSEREFAFESWDSQLQSLLQEGLTVTTSTGGPMGQEDSVSVSASGEDAKAMMELLRNAGIGHGGADGSHEMGPEVTDQDEVLGQLSGQEHDDSGDTDLSFLKKMIGTPVDADCGCEEGQTQTASPGDAHMSPMANKMDEADVEEGNLFTKGLEDDDVKIGQEIPGTNAIKTKDIDESDDLGPVKDTSGRCMMVHKTSGKEIVVRDEPDVIKKYEAMGYQRQVGESDDLGPVKDTGGRCNMVHTTSGKEIVVRNEPGVIAKYEALGYKKQVGESDDEDHKDHTEKSSTGGRIERKDGVTKHHAGKHYGGSESDDDDEDIKEDSYDAVNNTDKSGINDERSEAMRDDGLAASYVPEEALDQPATFEGKSCMECGSPMEESAHECNECGYMEAMHEDGMAEITIEKTPHGQLSVIKNGKQIATANYDSDSDSYWVFDPISKSDKAFDSKEEIIAHFSKHSMEEGYTFEGLFKKLAMIAEESTAEKDDKAETAGKQVTKDIEYDDKHNYYFGKDKGSSSKVRDTATGHKAEETDKGTKYTKKHDDKLDEWANSPQNKLSDEEFQTEMNYMLQALSGGLNGPKVDNTTLPKTQVRPVAESESLDGWLRLAGIK